MNKSGMEADRSTRDQTSSRKDGLVSSVGGCY